jgi:hypothetical protein
MEQELLEKKSHMDGITNFLDGYRKGDGKIMCVIAYESSIVYVITKTSIVSRDKKFT